MATIFVTSALHNYTIKIFIKLAQYVENKIGIIMFQINCLTKKLMNFNKKEIKILLILFENYHIKQIF